MVYSIDKDESKTIDYLKAIFIVLVLFIHTRAYTGKGFVNYGGDGGNLELNTPLWLWSLEYYISAVIAHCATPGFFVMSSILLYRKEFSSKDNIIKKTRTIVLPWFIVISFWIIFYATVQHISFIAPYFSNEDNIVANWKGFDFLDAYLGITRSPLVYPLWFLQNLFVLNIIAKPIKIFIDWAPKLVLFFLVILYILPFDHLLFCLEKRSLIWFALGYYIVKYGIQIRNIMKLNFYALSFMYLIVTIVTFLFRESSFVYIFDFFNIVFGILWFTSMCFRIHNCRILSTIGKYSFFIYITHEMSLRITLKAFTKILGNNDVLQILEYFAIPLAILIYCITIAKLIGSITPKVYQVLSGNR